MSGVERRKGRRTTEAVRLAIRESNESISQLVERFGVNHKTVLKWRKRTSVQSERPGPKLQQSTILNREEEAIIVSFRRFTMLPLDDCLYVLKAQIPQLTRASLHRCLRRYGINRSPRQEKETTRAAQIGEFVVTVQEIPSAQGLLFVYAGTDAGSHYIYAEVHKSVSQRSAAKFVRGLIRATPFQIRTILSTGLCYFSAPGSYRSSPRQANDVFEMACRHAGIGYQCVHDNYPWIEARSDGMRLEPIAPRHTHFKFESPEAVEKSVAAFMVQFNFSQRLKALRGLTPFQYVGRYRKINPADYLKRCPERLKRMVVSSLHNP